MGFEKLIVKFFRNCQEHRYVGAVEVVISNFKAYCKAVNAETESCQKEIDKRINHM